MRKKVVAVLLTAAMTMTMAVGCGSSSGSSSDSTKTADAGESYTIGISQFAEHGSWITAEKDF